MSGVRVWLWLHVIAASLGTGTRHCFAVALLARSCGLYASARQGGLVCDVTSFDDSGRFLIVDGAIGEESCSRVIFGEKTEVAFYRSFVSGGRDAVKSTTDGQNAQNAQKSATTTLWSKWSKVPRVPRYFLKTSLEGFRSVICSKRVKFEAPSEP